MPYGREDPTLAPGESMRVRSLPPLFFLRRLLAH